MFPDSSMLFGDDVSTLLSNAKKTAAAYPAPSANVQGYKENYKFSKSKYPPKKGYKPKKGQHRQTKKGKKEKEEKEESS